MALTRYTIVKSTPFQGKAEEFSNVYTIYSSGTPTESEASQVVTKLVDIEKPIHANTATFLRAYATPYGAGNSALYQTLLTGAGAVNDSFQAYKECAALIMLRYGVRWFTPKWYHCQMGGSSVMMDGSALLSGLQLTRLQGAAGALMADLIPGHYIKSPSADVRPVSFKIHPYLEHRQFHAGKKRKEGFLGIG